MTRTVLVTRPYRVLDLFCGEGGLSKGYEQAGLELLAAVDTDLRRVKAHYAYDHGVVHEMDWEVGLKQFADDADLIHASPPCQLYSTQTAEHRRADWPDLVSPVREALRKTGKPYVIENVPQAPLVNPVFLNGRMFSELQVSWDPWTPEHIEKIRANSHIDWDSGRLMWNTKQNGQRVYVRTYEVGKPIQWGLKRVRGFEIYGFTLTTPRELKYMKDLEVVTVTTSDNPTALWNKLNRRGIPLAVTRKLMGADWMSQTGLGESCPPAYSRHIGKTFLAQMRYLDRPRRRRSVSEG